MTVRLILALLVTSPGLAGAQETPAQIRERVAQIRDTVQLHVLERQYARSAASAAPLAAGLAALRLWELTGERTHARRARSHFDRVGERDARNAWAHYGHALSLQAEMNRDRSLIVTHIGAMRDLGLDPVSRARRALERAVALDPSLPGAVELLARYSVATRDDDGLLQARTSFEMSLASSRSATPGLLGVAMTARELGDYAGAVDAARRAVSADPESVAARLELALSLASIGDSLPAAGAAYRMALELADSAMLERLWEDAALLRTEREADEWQSAGTNRRRALLRTFWDVRGTLAGLTGGERAAEHYRRRTVARRQFARRGMFGAAPVNALRLEKVSAEYDDRGAIYIRHGHPDRTFGEPPLQSYIAWFYSDEEGNPLSYHFQKTAVAGSSKDYLLMRDLPCPLDPMVAAFDSRLTPLTRRCDPWTVRTVSAVIGRDTELALRTDSHRIAFDAALPFHFDWYTFRARGGTELLMAVGVPLDRLPSGQRSLRVRLSLVDTANVTMTHTDVVTELVERSPERGPIVRTHLSLLSAPSRRSVYRIDVRDASDPRIGTVYGGDIELPDYSGDTLMISDVMLAEQVDGGRLVRGDAQLALAPTQVFRAGEFRVYYEIYSMPADTPYRTELTVEPLRRGGIVDAIRRLFGGSDGVRLQFDDRAPRDATGTLRQVRDITAPFQPGAWLLRVTITTGTGSIVRERRFTIEQP